MDLRTRQTMEKNKRALQAAYIIIVVTSLVAGMTLLEKFSGMVIIRLLVGVIIAAFITAMYAKLKSSKHYCHFCCSSIAVFYIFSLATSKNPDIYAMAFAIAMMLMIYTNPLLTYVGSIIGGVGAVGFQIYMYVAGIGSLERIIVSALFLTSAITIAIVNTKLQIRLNDENIAEVKKGADAQIQTCNSVVELAEVLGQRFQSAQEVSMKLNETMESSNNAMVEIAESTRINAEAIEQQTNRTSDIQVSIQEVGSEARTMGEISERTNATVQEGVELISRLKVQATEVAKINTETRVTTQNLNESIKDVQAITETILGISSQTNLLALNASIEAARAGEAGKGFAVVAEEIRTLSEDTRKATEKISEIIAKLTVDAENASNSMSQSAHYADMQNELITETGEKLMEIKDDTDALHEGVAQVNRSVENIITANTLIMDSITNLSATGEEVAASTDTAMEISDSSIAALQDMNGLLNDIAEISRKMEDVARAE